MTPEQFSLGELITELESHDPETPVRLGISEPHSYRGYYDDLAFETVGGSTVGAMLEVARSALNRIYFGYKGGEFTMTEGTPVWLASYGCTGESLGKVMLSLMLDTPSDATAS